MQESVDRLWKLIVELGRVRSLRDPLVGIPGHDLTSAQRHAVLWLGLEGALPVGTLGQRIGSPVPATTGVVDRLEKLGIVQRERGAADRRVVHVSLTDEGQKLHDEIQGAITEHLTALLGMLSPDDREGLLDILTRLADTLARATTTEPKTTP